MEGQAENAEKDYIIKTLGVLGILARDIDEPFKYLFPFMENNGFSYFLSCLASPHTDLETLHPKGKGEGQYQV